MKTAFKWYSRAAAQNYLPAIFNLIQMYLERSDTESLDNAGKWIEKAKDLATSAKDYAGVAELMMKHRKLVMVASDSKSAAATAQAALDAASTPEAASATKDGTEKAT